MKASIALACVCVLIPISAFAHTVRQQISSYQDNQGMNRNRMLVDLNCKFAHSGRLSDTSYVLLLSRDTYQKDSIDDDKYMQEVYGTNKRVNDTFQLNATQTWNRITDTRVTVGGSDDDVVQSRSGGLGVSHWFFHETLQASIDASRTLVDRPVFEILDKDSDIISPPATLESTGVSVGLKHLATAHTMTNYSVTHIETNERPPSNTYAFGIRQYIPVTDSAVHFNIARAVNRGRITTKTSYGEVDAWIGEIAFLQSLWQGGNARIAYRLYKEDEVTRVEKNEYVRGSDTFSLNLSQLVGKTSLEAGAMRYMTNELESGEKVAANIYEAGLMVRF